MTKNNREIYSILSSLHENAQCELNFSTPFELLVAVILSAQCTDERVNIVCRDLFRELPTVEEMAEAPVEQIESLIKSCGLYRSKAKSIKESSEILVRDFLGQVPDNMEDLLSLPGVGRKIANLLRGDIFGEPAVVADTHCIRICGRLGMYRESLKDAHKVEIILSELIAPEKQSDFCHRIVQFGRDVCTARSPKCEECPISHLCERAIKSTKNKTV